MDWISGIQRAIDYIEEHLTEEIDLAEAAECACSSAFHFLRVFGIVCGYTPGEYVRMRRLSLAGADILEKRRNVTEAALHYGYETPESFSRAFRNFHGILPSQVKQGCSLKAFSPISIKLDMQGGNTMNYKIEKRPAGLLVGYKKRFCGVPYGAEREKQEDRFFRTTRAKQWLLRGASDTPEIDYCVIKNIDEEGYDFYIAYNLDEWSRTEMFNPAVTGVDFMDKLCFEQIEIPPQTYAVFETPKMRRPIMDYVALRQQIVTEWLPSADYVFADAPEIVAMHWPVNGDEAKQRYIEICLPVENKF